MHLFFEKSKGRRQRESKLLMALAHCVWALINAGRAIKPLFTAAHTLTADPTER